MSPEKRVDRAIEIARRSGMPLKIAAKIYPEERRYFDETLAPLIAAAGPLVEFVGEIGDRERDELLGRARRAAVPDRVARAVRAGDDRGPGLRDAGDRLAPRDRSRRCWSDGVTGYIVESVDEAVAAVGRLDRLSRRRLPRVVRASGSTRGAWRPDHVEVYRRVIVGRRECRAMERGNWRA